MTLERSRAVRDSNTGSRADPSSDDNWNKAFIQFWANISLHVEKKVPDFVGILQHHQFDAMFNPRIKQPQPTERKQILRGQVDEDVAADYDLNTDNEDDMDVAESAPMFGMQSLVTPPHMMIPGPPHDVPGTSGDYGDGPPSGPTTCKRLQMTPAGKCSRHVVNSIHNKF